MNKRLFLKMSLATLPILALFSKPVLAEENIHFSSCKEAWANGYSDIHEGEPGYSAKLDRDHDGVACELKNAPKGAFKAKQSTVAQTNTSSATTSGWVEQDGAWYYFDENGNPVKNAWQGNYYLKSDGKMAQGEWIYDSSYQAWYYLKSDGFYARNAWQGSYYLKSNGKMAKGEWIYDNNYSSYYYLTSEGSYAHGTWVGDYYLKSNGKMAVNERTPDGYQVDGSGKWISSEGTHTASSSQATSLGISLYHVNDAMTYIDIALPSTPSSSYQVAYDFALVDANTGSVSTQTQFTVTYNPSLRAFQTRHFFSATPDGSYRFVIKGKGQDGKVYDGQSVVFRVKNHRFVGQMNVAL